MVSSKLRRHKVMEKAIRKLMGNNLPPRFKFKDTYGSIEVPEEYQAQLVSVRTELEQEFEAMLEEEEAMPTLDAVSDDLQIITANVYSNTTTGRIGIGTANPSGTLHVHSTDSIVVPSGTTAQRSQTPVNGMLRYNSETGYFETYTVSGWGSLATPPSIASFTPTVVETSTSSGTQITVTGSFFDEYSSIKLRGSDGTEYSTTGFSFTSTTTISATLPYLPGFPKSPYTVVVTAGSGLSTESTDTLVSGNTPVWSSPAAGATVGVYTGESTTITLSVTDADGDTLTYSIVSGTLPGGLTLSGNQISGTSTAAAGSTSTITVRASDGELYADRTFTIETKGLYAFTTHTFTNAGATGRIGPTLTQLRNAYTPSWTDDTNYLNVTTQGIQEWTVPETGTYEFEVAGAGNNTFGGRGVICNFNYDLTLNTKLMIVVGQMGKGYSNQGAAGSGCSAVYIGNSLTNASVNNLLAIGGGSSPYRDASTTTAGVSGDGSNGGAAGTNGNGGSTGRDGAAQAGAGFLSDGGGTNIVTFDSERFEDGFTGGELNNAGMVNITLGGGFGGGGDAFLNSTFGPYLRSGGGGGYSGGGGGGYGGGYSASDGGGGGSYMKNTTLSQSYSYNSGGHGYVTITKI